MTTNNPPPPKSRPINWRFIAVSLLIVALVVPVVPFGLGIVTMRHFTHGTCVRRVTPDEQTLTVQAVDIPFNDETIPAALLTTDRSPAAVIIAPAWQTDHYAQMDIARIFHDAGLNVLMLGSPFCDGDISTLGYREADRVAAAYRYLAAQDSIDAEQISVHGFSVGGAAALYAAARTPQLQAVSAMGNYHDFNATISAPGDPWYLQLHAAGMQTGFWATTGIRLSALSPVNVMADVNPRPIYLIYGTDEPAIDAQRLHAATENSTLWFVTGAGHGDYMQVAPDEMRARLGGFHAGVLQSAD